MSNKRHGRARSLAISAWPVRFKVALAITLPLLLAFTFGLIQVRDDLVEADNSSTSAKQVTILPPTIDYLTAAERAMVAAQGTSDADAADLDAAVQDVQAAADEMTRVRDSADLTADQRYQLDALLDLSRAIREANDSPLSSGTWVAQLRQLQSGVTRLITSIVNAQINPEPRLELLAQTLAGRFSLAMQQALAATERSGDTGSLELFAELGVESAAIDRLASELGEEPEIAALRTDNAQRTREVRTGGDDLGGDAAYAEYDQLIDTLTVGIDEQLAAAADDARRSALISGGITLLALLATLILAFLISRLLLNPLRKVREGAREVANEQLPEAVARIRAGEDPGPITPIDVTTHEEVGQLARAVDELHRQAVALASEEAALRSQVSEMFITLSRRNTTLVNQQLALIERLEKDEEDPRRLESLFRLDHLAARMRRTADSLLVLADAPTHTAAEEDLTVDAALQAATAGVQDYQRVRVGATSTARISDDAAADIVHLLTELVDNALSYSPPTTSVHLSSTTTPSGATIAVEDAGLGIPDEALAELNETLHSGVEVTPDTARRMGLFVVSRLAQRHGITVALKRNDRNGTTATIQLPSNILSVAPPTPVPPPARSAEPATPPAQRAPEAGEPGGPSLEDRLNASIDLPRRQPGAQTPQTSPQAAASSPSPQTAPPAATPGSAALRPGAVAPPPGVVAPPPGAVAPPPGAVAPPPGVVAPPPGAVAPPPGVVAPPPGAVAPPPGVVAPPPGVAAPPPGVAAPSPAPTSAPEPTTPPASLPRRTSPAEQPVTEPVAEKPSEPDPIDVESTDDRRPSVPSLTVVPPPAPRPARPDEAESVDEPTHELPETPVAPVAPVAPLTGATASEHSRSESSGLLPLADSEAEADTPIFKALRSAWLSAGATAETWRSSEIEAGWARADSVAASLTEAPVNEAGLPVRRPGARVVPGGVAKPAANGVRDPEAIRARLAAHAAGVSRGRAAAATGPDSSTPEETPS